ncbi:sn-glycerol-1-phosphate dehydrogenase [Rubrobacter indicoceani]|uniref:sn-glycerol-1-phosphate dehydrogenase n=1 Tax=Rubrobacter indicoceani TaxID=2051957 RepID=UPI000E5BEE51|nr:sn-glycerol-1-phosphate dehydrogenase [Rubrobacter indicoceani]
MKEALIEEALGDATDTQSVTIAPDALAHIAGVFARSFGDRKAVVIADEDTFAVAGEKVQRVLEEAGRRTVEPYVFPGTPMLYAGYGNIEKLVGSLGGHDAVPVAVGSGTLNDLVKRAAYECGRPYLCVGTAASMDGYTSFGASISKDGRKQTLECPAPRAVVGDVDVLAGAPGWMTASGYADLLCKVTAGADWLIADALGTEEIHPRAWALVHDHLREWTADPAGLAAGDLNAMDALMEGLTMAGLAMQVAASSRPASGAEHMFSHLWEMEGLGHDSDPPLSHGFKVGVGSIAVAALYERVLERDLSQLDVEAVVAAWPSWEEVEREVRATHTVPGLDEYAVEESRAKHVDAEALRERLELLGGLWPDLWERLRAQLMPADELRGLLRAAGCPVTPGEIGLSREDFRATYHRARTIRRRYNVLDLTVETGIFEECVEELFAPGGFWAEEDRA